MSQPKSKVPFIIIGILAIIGGIITMIFPLDALSIVLWIIVFILIVSGIIMVVTNVKGRKENRGQKIGIAGIVMGVLIGILGLLALFVPGIRATLAIVLVSLFAISLIFRGIDLLTSGFAGAAVMPAFNIIFGIMLIISGVNGFIYLFSAAITMGIFFGCGLIVFGISMLSGAPFGKNGDQQQEQ